MTGIGRAPGFSNTMMTIAAGAIGACAALDAPDLAKLGCLGIAALIVCFAGVTSAVSLVFIALPFVMVQISVGRTEWSPLELALLACWLATGVELARRLVIGRNWRTIQNVLEPWDLTILAVAFATVGALSLLWIVDGGSRADSVRELRRVILEPIVLVPALALIRKRGEIRSTLPWMVAPAVSVALLAAMQLVFQTSVVEIGSISRPIGTFTHPNNLAFYLERAVWFAPLVAVPRLGASAPASWASAAIIAVGCALTLSRGALLALAVGGVVVFWQIIRPNWKRYVMGVAGLGALAILSRWVFGDGELTSNRATIWRASLDMLRDHPLRGVGLDQFFGQYGRRYVEPEGWLERYTSHPHNLLLDYWLRLGLPGLVLLWGLLELSYRRLRYALADPAWTVQRSAVAMLVAGFVHGIIDNSFFLADLAAFTWIGLALASPADVEGRPDGR